jgi:hypothetical protein
MRRPSDASTRAHQATSAIRQRLRLVVATEALSAARIPIASGSRRWIGRRRSSSGVDAHRGGGDNFDPLESLAIALLQVQIALGALRITRQAHHLKVR